MKMKQNSDNGRGQRRAVPQHLMKAPKKNRNIYLDGHEFGEEIAKWRAQAPDPKDRRVSDRLALMLMSIPEHMACSPSFRYYDLQTREDLKMDAYVKMAKNLKNFKPEYGTNPFNYFTRCCACSFYETIMKYYRHRNMLRELKEELRARGFDVGDDLQDEQFD